MTRLAWVPSTNRAGPGPRTALAVLAGKGTGLASRLLGRGGGTALPGLVAERLDPRIVERLASQVEAPRVVVTGTNGKTTTSRLLGAILRAAGHRPIRNGAGSNLMRGIAATLLHEAGTGGRLPPDRPAVFEVDEATLVQAGRALRPNVLVFTNLFRDQLDRYGEIDSVADVWREALQALLGDARIVLNADDPLVARLSSVPEGRSVLYGIEDRSVALGEAEHASDSRWCPRCDRDYTYEALFFGHIGWWRCSQCGDHRPTPDVGAADVRLVDDERASFSLRVG
ncbi:MAG TPA: Mur ligase family protein, partial [Dehalococcoidia bacterium]|nr:Mur ligase family protein [Dehalococcoidia bacterium]